MTENSEFLSSEVDPWPIEFVKSQRSENLKIEYKRPFDPDNPLRPEVTLQFTRTAIQGHTAYYRCCGCESVKRKIVDKDARAKVIPPSLRVNMLTGRAMANPECPSRRHVCQDLYDALNLSTDHGEVDPETLAELKEESQYVDDYTMNQSQASMSGLDTEPDYQVGVSAKRRRTMLSEPDPFWTYEHLPSAHSASTSAIALNTMPINPLSQSQPAPPTDMHYGAAISLSPSPTPPSQASSSTPIVNPIPKKTTKKVIKKSDCEGKVSKSEATEALQTLWKYAFEQKPSLINSIMQLQKDFVLD